MSRWTTTLTEEALGRLVLLAQQIVPELDGSAPSRIGEGISTISFGWPGPGDGWVLRVSRDHPRPWTWRGGRADEPALAAELRRRGVPVADDAVVVEEVDGLPSAILERRVVGEPLTAERFGADPRMAGRLATALDRLHGIAVDDPVVARVPRDDCTGEFRHALTTVDLPVDLHRRAEHVLARLEARTDRLTFCHRDFRLTHLIMDDDGELAGLLDLGDVGIDDPAMDLAFMYGELGPEAVAAIASAMTSADDGIVAATRAISSLWPLLELLPGGEFWGDPTTARDRLADLIMEEHE